MREKTFSSPEQGTEVENEVGEVEEKEVVLPGFRFHPTDEELIGFYLRRKVDNKPIPIEIIKQIDIYKYDPWDLPKVSTVGGEEWYFFCLRGRKYRNSIRPNRVTGSGFWKATGIDRPIHSSSAGRASDCIGLKKSLVYYRGSAGKGTKTDWMLHEFRLPSKNSPSGMSPSAQEAEVWTICRIFKRNISRRKYAAQEWKQLTVEQPPGESSSKTSSINSDAGDEYKYLGCAGANMQQGESFFLHDQIEGNCQLSGEGLQVPFPTTLYQQHEEPPPPPWRFDINPAASEFFEEGSWDELGRMMEYMMDPSGATQDCRYYY